VVAAFRPEFARTFKDFVDDAGKVAPMDGYLAQHALSVMHEKELIQKQLSDQKAQTAKLEEM